MVTPLWAGTIQPGGARSLPPGLHVLHVYTQLKMSSSKVSVIIRNMLGVFCFFLKKGMQVARVVCMASGASGALPGDGGSSGW